MYFYPSYNAANGNEPEDTTRDPVNGLNWRSSAASPGTDDRKGYSTWRAGAAEPDADNDRFSNIAEYMLGGNTTGDSSALIPLGSWQQYTVSGISGTYATISFSRAINHEEFIQRVEFSTDLTAWPIGAAQVSAADNGDGTHTEVWRSSSPVSAGTRLFGRIRFSQP